MYRNFGTPNGGQGMQNILMATFRYSGSLWNYSTHTRPKLKSGIKCVTHHVVLVQDRPSEKLRQRADIWQRAKYSLLIGVIGSTINRALLKSMVSIIIETYSISMVKTRNGGGGGGAFDGFGWTPLPWKPMEWHLPCSRFHNLLYRGSMRPDPPPPPPTMLTHSNPSPVEASFMLTVGLHCHDISTRNWNSSSLTLCMALRLINKPSWPTALAQEGNWELPCEVSGNHAGVFVSWVVPGWLAGWLWMLSRNEWEKGRLSKQILKDARAFHMQRVMRHDQTQL